MKRERIARELIKLAKSIVAQDSTIGSFVDEDGFRNGVELAEAIANASKWVRVGDSDDPKFTLEVGKMSYNRNYEENTNVDLYFDFEFSRRGLKAAVARFEVIGPGTLNDESSKTVAKASFKLNDSVQHVAKWVDSVARKNL